MAAHHVEFDNLVRYDPSRPGISIPITIGIRGHRTSLEAKIDTGSSICIFEREHGEKLGLDIETGLLQKVSTATGSFTSYGFRVGLTVAGMNFDSLVYFAAGSIGRNVLGRHGWLEMIKLGLVDYEGKVYLSRFS